MTFMMRVQLMEERKYQREMVLEECTFNLVCHDRKCQMIPVLHTHFSPRKNEYILSFPPGKMSIY